MPLLLVPILLVGCEHRTDTAAISRHNGAVLITRQACGACHRIPGIEEADGTVGPPLDRFASQKLIAGALPNRPGNLAGFLKSPRSFVKDSVMPEQHLSDEQIRDVAAYLYTLK